MPAPGTSRRDRRIVEIQRVAVDVFARNGFRATSMTDIAEAVGLSRPALYQYYENKADLFRAALAAITEEMADAALAALMGEGTVAERLDDYLQRLKGDGYERLAASPYGLELIEARTELAADVVAEAFARAHHGLRAYLGAQQIADGDMRDAAIDLMIHAPASLGRDDPPTAVYRNRLRGLARAVALGLLEAR